MTQTDPGNLIKRKWSLWARSNYKQSHWILLDVQKHRANLEWEYDRLTIERIDLELILLPPGEKPLMHKPCCHMRRREVEEI